MNIQPIEVIALKSKSLLVLGIGSIIAGLLGLIIHMLSSWLAVIALAIGIGSCIYYATIPKLLIYRQGDRIYYQNGNCLITEIGGFFSREFHIPRIGGTLWDGITFQVNGVTTVNVRFIASDCNAQAKLTEMVTKAKTIKELENK